MNDKINGLFLSDSVYGYSKTETNNLPAQSQTDQLQIYGENSLTTPADYPLGAVDSIDHRIREAIKPTMSDADLLKPKIFSSLLIEATVALEKEIEEVTSPEVKSSLNSLKSILKENLDLCGLFQSYTNWLQKI